MSEASPTLRRFVTRQFAVSSPFWSWMIFERVGGALAFVFLKLHLTPNLVTVLGGVAGVVGATRLATATSWFHVLQAVGLLLTAYSLDCADGQLARATGTASAFGAWLDVTMDSVVIAFLATSLAYALGEGGYAAPWSFLLAGAFGASRTASLFTSRRVRGEDGGLRLNGVAGAVRAGYVALIETPFVYVLLCLSRLEVDLLAAVVAGVALLSAGKTAVSARAHFGAQEGRDAVAQDG